MGCVFEYIVYTLLVKGEAGVAVGGEDLGDRVDVGSSSKNNNTSTIRYVYCLHKKTTGGGIYKLGRT
jgi:hypothetical protein